MYLVGYLTLYRILCLTFFCVLFDTVSSIVSINLSNIGMLVSLSDDVKEQLTDAAQQTNKAYAAVRKGREGDTGDGIRGGGSFQEPFKTSSTSIGNYLAPEITTMQPILRYLQLLCENHNSDMQVWWRSGSVSCHMIVT